MGATIIDGRAVASAIHDELQPRVEYLRRNGIIPRLAVLLVGDNPASLSYIRAKRRACERINISTEDIRLPHETSQSDLITRITELNTDPKVHAILIQLPLPSHISTSRVLETIDPRKDVDGFHPHNMGRLARGEECLHPCTPAGIVELLTAYNIQTTGAHAVIVGRSTIVGRPLALMLMQKAPRANATVTVCHSGTPNIGAETKRADIVVAAVGVPEYIRATMIKKGAVVIDVGINRVADTTLERGYRLCGDVAYNEVLAHASFITPVPGGVGPMTIAILLRNTLKAIELQQQSPVT